MTSPSCRSFKPHRQQGVALVIVLAFVALLSGVVVAYFSRSMTDRQLSNSSYNGNNADAFARSAADIIIGDLKQEIVNGSTADPATGAYADGTNSYFPKKLSGQSDASANMVPASNLTTAERTAVPNLIRRSKASDDITTNNPAAVASRASAVNSQSQLSANGRSVSLARWNKHYLIPLKTPANYSDTTPDSSTFTAPDWVVVTAEKGPSVLSTPAKDSGGNAVTPVGRYAFAIYDEGGLLDINVAGFPPSPNSTAAQYAYKPALAYADLTSMGSFSLTTGAVNDLVGWRNYATVQAPGSFGSFTSFTPTIGTNFFKYVTGNTSGFLKVNNTAWNNRTDQTFLSRQQLINYATDAKWNANKPILQYLTHFSRDLNQPSYIPAVQNPNVTSPPVVLAASLGGNSAVGGDKLINPSFPAVRVGTTFKRFDWSAASGLGADAAVGEPLVNKRFVLNRLAWITYKGPSATRNQGDPDIQAVINSGIPWSYLQQGNDLNIKNYLGLTWDGAKNRWTYDLHRGTSGSNRIIKLVGQSGGGSPDASRYVQDSGREPDFFELLKAGITVGSLGKTATNSATYVKDDADPAKPKVVPDGYAQADVPANFRYNLDSSVDYHVVQIGANILSEINPTSFPVRIAFDDGSARGVWEFQGVTDLPYLSYVFNGVLRKTNYAITPPASPSGATDSSPFQYPRAAPGTVTTQGEAYAIQVPAVWNPYDPNGTYGPNSATPPPSGFRPTKFRVVIDSNDPISLANGGANKLVWCAALASPRTTLVGGNQGLKAPWTPGNVSSLDATVNPTSKAGVAVSDAVTFDDSNGSLYREPTLIFNPSVGGANRTSMPGNPAPAGNITALDANPLPGQTDGSKGPWTPLVLGKFPLAFQFAKTNINGTSNSSMANPVMFTGCGQIGNGGTTDTRVYFTYRLQYEYPAGSNSWVTYDTKYGRTTHGFFSYQARFDTANPVFTPTVIMGPVGNNPFSWASAIDPRTARFGLIMTALNAQRSQAGGASPPSAWIFDSSGNPTTASTGITYPLRPDYMAGFYFVNCDEKNLPSGGKVNTNGKLTDLDSTLDVPYPSFAAGWTAPVINLMSWSFDAYMFAPGAYAQNNPRTPFYPSRYVNVDTPNDNSVQPAYYADADGVVRRAAGAYVPVGTKTSASTPVGLPTASIQGYPTKPASLVTPATATPFTQSQSRPLLLHRPFRTVAELGYVFRDLPWKNLDFFTPESGDAALLDLFCINETSEPSALIAGKVNLNTRQAPVLAAIVSAAYVDDPKISDATVGSISNATSTPVGNAVANALVARTTDTASTNGPLQNVSDLVGKWTSAVAPASGGIAYGRFSGSNWGIDLPSGNYQDGQSSYVGFSGATAVGSPAKDLGSAYSAATFSTTAATNTALKTSMSQVQRFREAPIRALATVGQTRVWNLMIDVVAQTGRYPLGLGANTPLVPDKFVVEGEQRYWIHVAIDRLTGNILDKQVEVVKE